MSIESEALRRVLLEQEQTKQPMSQSDQVVITQSEPDAPGFYVDQYQSAQDAFNSELLRQQSAAAYYQPKQQVAGPPTASVSITDMTMGNPNYTVNDKGGNVTVNEAGHIVRY